MKIVRGEPSADCSSPIRHPAIRPWLGRSNTIRSVETRQLHHAACSLRRGRWLQEGGGKFEEDSSAGFIGIWVAAVAEDHDARLPTGHNPVIGGGVVEAAVFSLMVASLS